MAIAEELAALRERTLAEIAAADTSAALEAVRVAVLGKSGTLTGYLRSMGQVPAEERASVGRAVNAARVDVEEALAARKAALDAAELEAAMGAAAVDVTLPGRAQQVVPATSSTASSTRCPISSWASATKWWKARRSRPTTTTSRP